MSAYGSLRFSLILVASCFLTRDADGPAPPEQAKTIALELLCLVLLFIFISLDALVIFVCIFYGLRAALRVRVENFHIEENAIRAGAPQTGCLDVQSSVIISSGGITREHFSVERLKFWLHLGIVANVIHQVCKHVSDFVVSYVRIPAFGAR